MSLRPLLSRGFGALSAPVLFTFFFLFFLYFSLPLWRGFSPHYFFFLRIFHILFFIFLLTSSARCVAVISFLANVEFFFLKKNRGHYFTLVAHECSHELCLPGDRTSGAAVFDPCNRVRDANELPIARRRFVCVEWVHLSCLLSFFFDVCQ